MDPSKQNLALINSSEQNLCSDIWTIVSDYLEFKDKISLRGVCKASRRHNHIVRVPRSVEITDDIIERIPALTHLTYLNVCYNPNLTDKSIEKLTQLRTLNASYNPSITNKSIEKLTRLTTLVVRGNPSITDKSIEKLTQLRTLNASYNPNITDKSIEKLTQLRTLDAWDNPKITDKSIEKLTQLRTLYTSWNPNISNNQRLLDRLRKLNPSIKIYQ